MAEHSYESLKSLTVKQLRELAAKMNNPEVTGFTQKRKDEIIHDICSALNIDMHAHHDVVGIDKKAVKAKIAEWKEKRAAALEAKDAEGLKMARKKVRRLRRKLRRAMV